MDYAGDSDSLYEGAACGLLVTEANGTILRANRTFGTWIGRTSDELRSRRFQTLLTVGGRIFHQTHWLPLLKLQGSVSEVKLELLHQNGQRIPMVMNAVVRHARGGEFHELAIFSARDRHQYEVELVKSREVAEQHLSREQHSQRELADAREQLELARDAAQLFGWSVALPSRARHYDAGVALLMGYPEPLPVDAGEFFARVHPVDQASARVALEDFLDVPEGRFKTVFRLQGIDRRERWVAAWGRPRSDAAGQLIGLVGFMQDVTDAYVQRALAEDRALLAEQTLAIVGHDLRNPLSAIQMAGEILGLRRLDLQQQHALAARIQSSTRRAGRLIADLLDFTQARTGRRLPLKMTLIDGHAVARDVVTELAAAHPAREIRHEVIGEGRITADGDRIAQALGNLISNALTYGTPATPVTVRSEERLDGLGYSVHNLGTPIDEGARASLFEPMTRGTTSGQRRSVGLGLYIVREIALAHGGTVDFESSRTAGTIFSLLLPRARSE